VTPLAALSPSLSQAPFGKMPRKTHASSQRPRRRSNSTSSYASSSPSSSSSASASSPRHQDRPLRHAATMPAPAPMGPHAAMPPRMAPPGAAVPATLPPFSTLHLHVHSAQNLHVKSRYAYCKMFVGDPPMVDNTVLAPLTHPQLQSFKTAVALADQSQPAWNSDFEIRINDPRVDVLSVLVKRQQLLCCPIVGVCVVSLRSLLDASGVDQWFPLRKGPYQTGHIRLQMLLKRIERPTISPRAPAIGAEAVAGYGAAAPWTQAFPDRARSLEDDARRLQSEQRRRREVRTNGKTRRDRRERRREPKASESSDRAEEKRSSVRGSQAVDGADEEVAASVGGVRLEKGNEGLSERSASSQSRTSHTCGESGPQVDSVKPSSPASVRAASSRLERRTLDADLYGELPVSARVGRSYGRERRRETCKSDPIPASMLVVGSDSIKSACSSPTQQTHSAMGHENAAVNDIELYAKCGAQPPSEELANDEELNDLTWPRSTAEKSGVNEDRGSETDSELSSSAESASPVPSRSRRHRHKSKTKQRHKHRRHKHRQDDLLPSQGEVYPVQPEIPTYTAAPICVLPPPPPSNGNGVAAKKLALIASRVASIALLGADYTKAFTNTAGNQVAASVATDVALEGVPVVAESEGYGFGEIE
jgi:hypothetical protein